MLTSSSSPPPHDPPKRRRRIVLTCARCQRLKVRCDHETPCGACIQAGTVDQCTYQSSASAAASLSPGAADIEEPPPPQPHRPAKRRRAILVCTRCKRLKLRCDHNQPCGACVRGRLGEACVYQRWPDAPPASTASPPPLRAPSPPGTPNGLQNDVAEAAARLDSAGNNPDLATQLHRIEAKLDRIISSPNRTSHSTPTQQTRQYNYDDLGDLVLLFPPVEACRSILRVFYTHDVMFRRVQESIFSERAEDVFRRLSIGAAFTDDDAPFLTVLATALHVGICMRGIDTGGQGLQGLVDGLFAYCLVRAFYTIDWAYAHLIAIDLELGGPTGTPQGAWLMCGKAYHAALLAGVHVDHPGESVYDQQNRRRLWYHIKLTRGLIAPRLKLENALGVEPWVPRPLLISDRTMEASMHIPANSPMQLPSSPEDDFPEWSHVDLRISFVEGYLQNRPIILTQTDRPLMMRLADCQQLLEDWSETLPPQMRIATAPKSPPWIYALACAAEMNQYDTLIQLYLPYFSDPEAGTFSLTRAIGASHQLVRSARDMCTFHQFEWLDNASSSLWIGPSKVFLGGMVLAYALMLDPNNNDAADQMTSLSMSIGVLRSFVGASPHAHTNTRMGSGSGSNATTPSIPVHGVQARVYATSHPSQPSHHSHVSHASHASHAPSGTSTATQTPPSSGARAIATLESLRKAILERSNIDHVVDPFSGHGMALPRPKKAGANLDQPAVDLLTGQWGDTSDWNAWENLFKELFQVQ